MTPNISITLTTPHVTIERYSELTGLPVDTITREPKKKETAKVKRRRKKTAAPKEPEAKQGDYLVGTDENVLVLNRTYANRSNAERAAKTLWERCNAGWRHSPCSSQKVGPISIPKCR